MACRALCALRHPLQRDRAGVFRDKSKQGDALRQRRNAHGADGKNFVGDEISDLIGCLLWLSDEKASGFVTGTVIPVDGGFSAYSGV